MAQTIWEFVGRQGNNIYSLLAHPNGTIFAGTLAAGLYRSTDNGLTWELAQSGMTNADVYALAVNSSGQVYAGTNGGVFRSNDNGNSWVGLNSGLSDLRVRCLAIGPGGQLFAGTDGGGIFRSTNGGTTWQQINANLTQLRIAALTVGTNGIVYAGTEGDGVWRSTNNGDSWLRYASGLAGTSVRSLTINQQGHIFAGTGGIFRSTDNGATWQSTIIGLTQAFVYSLVVGPDNYIYAGTEGGGFFRSYDNGGSWVQLNKGLTNTKIRSVAINSSYHIFVGTTGSDAESKGIYKSTLFASPPPPPADVSWIQSSFTGSVANVKIRMIIEKFGTTWAFGDGGIVARATDASLSSWVLANNGIPSNEAVIWMEPASSTILFAGTDAGKIYKSTNAGGTWALSYSDPDNVTYINYVKFFDENRGIAVGDYSSQIQTRLIFYLETTNGGATWNNNNALMYGTSSPAIVRFTSASAGFHTGSLTVGGQVQRGLWVTTNLGRQWTYRPVGVGGTADRDVSSIAMDFRDDLTGVVARNDSSLWVTLDGGVTWRLLGKAPERILFVSIPPGSNWVYGVGERGVLVQANFGNSLYIMGSQYIDRSKTFTRVSFPAINKGYAVAYGSTPSGQYFILSNTPATSVEKITSTSHRFFLEQNYPNPFNPSTVIEFSLPERSFVKLTIMNLLGQEIETLIAEEREAGSYRVKWNAGNFPTGTYFYRLQAGGFAQIKKLILLK